MENQMENKVEDDISRVIERFIRIVCTGLNDWKN